MAGSWISGAAHLGLADIVNQLTIPPPRPIVNFVVSSSIEHFRVFAWELRRSFRELAAAADEGFRPLGISVGDRAVLEFLSRERRPVSLSELARKHAVSRQHVHQAIRRLPDSAWVKISVKPNDARAVTVMLSPAGRAFWRRVQAWEEKVFLSIARSLDADEVKNATAFLRTLRASLAEPQETRNEA